MEKISLAQQLIDGIQDNNNDKVSELLNRMKVEAINGTPEGAWTPLHFACENNNNEAVELLLAIPGINVNAMINSGETPLHYACFKNNSQAVVLLLANPTININTRNGSGLSPIMFSALRCHSESLMLMLEDLRVDLDSLDNDGRGLEELVGLYAGNSTDKDNCIAMIIEEKYRRENNHEKEGHEDIDRSRPMASAPPAHSPALGLGQAEQDLEEVRANIIEKIDKLNQEIGDREQSLEGKLEIRKVRMKELKDKQDLEKKTLGKNLKEEEIKLEKRKAKYEQQIANVQRKKRDNEKIIKRHEDETDTLEEKFKKEDKEDQQQLDYLKDMTNQFATDLGKLDVEPGNDASSNDHTNMEAVRENLECPICLEIMRPPTRIWMCSSSHIVCESCKDQIEGKLCPTCRTERITLRAFIVEQIARTIFNE